MSAIAPPPLRIAGERNFRLDDPKPELVESADAEDSLSEAYTSSTQDRFRVNAVHPRFPGMIIDQVRTTEIVVGSLYRHALVSLGDYYGERPTKILSVGEKTSLAEGWDEIPMEYLTWLAKWKAVTGTAGTDVFDCPGHGYAAGQAVMFRDTAGAAEIVPASDTALGTKYFVINPTPGKFQISATLGGAALDITTNLTAGYVCAAEFVKGARHPDHEHMWLVDVQKTTRNRDWQRVSGMYRGMIHAKPYKRIITCNGQTMSPSNITVTFPDGFTSKPNGQVSLPKIQCRDVYLTTTALATDEVPLSESEGATPPDPPDIRSMVLTADDDQLTYHWPNGWTRPAEEHVDSIPLVAVNLKARTSEYVWPVTFA